MVVAASRTSVSPGTPRRLPPRTLENSVSRPPLRRNRAPRQDPRCHRPGDVTEPSLTGNAGATHNDTIAIVRQSHFHAPYSALGARLDMISHRVLRSGLRPTRSNACGSSTLRPRRRRGVMCTSAIAALHPSRARGVMPVAWRFGTNDRPSRRRSCERTSIVGRFARVTSSDRRPTHGTRTSTGDATASKNEGGP